MTRTSRADGSSPVRRILGDDAARGGPFALLGLAPRGVTQRHVIAARNQRLAAVDLHPLAETPEADEVRLAIHAAAAHLLNPQIRAHMLARWGGRPVHEQPAPAAAEEPLPPADALEQDALITLAMHGGWNPEAMRRLALLACARGLPVAAVHEALQRLTRRRSAAAMRPRVSAATTASTGAQPSQSAADKAEPDPIRTAAIVIGVFLAAVVLFTVGFITLTNVLAPEPSIEPADTPEVIAQTRPTTPTPQPRTNTSSRPEREPEHTSRTTAIDFDRVAYDLAQLPAEASAAVDLRRIIGRVEHAWVAAPIARRDGLVKAIATHAARIEPAAEVPAILDAIAVPTDPFERRLLAVLVLDRLRMQTNSPVARTAERRLQTFGGATAERALSATADVLASDLDVASADREGTPWRAWVAAVTTLHPPRGPAATRVLLDGLDALVRTNAPDTDALRELVLALSWRAGDGAQRWLVDRLAGTDATTSALAEVTRIVASESSASGVDPTMVLSRTGSREARLLLADAYAKTWSDRPRGGPVVGQLRAEAARLDRQPPSSVPIAQLRRAVERARVLADLLEWSRLGVEPTTAPLDTRRVRSASTDTDPLTGTMGSDGAWALRLARADNDPDKVSAAFDDLALKNADPGIADARALISAALRMPTRSLRDKAFDVVLVHGQAPAVLAALLDAIPSQRPSDRLGELVFELTTERPDASTDDAWRAQAIDALARELLTHLPEDEQTEVAVELSGALAAALGRATTALASTSTPADPSTTRPDAAADALADAWLQRVRGVAGDGSRIERRLSATAAARASLASGPVSRTAAAVTTAFEAQAHATRLAVPSVTDRVDALEADTRMQLARDGTSLEQLDTLLTASFKLELIAMGEADQ